MAKLGHLGSACFPARGNQISEAQGTQMPAPCQGSPPRKGKEAGPGGSGQLGGDPRCYSSDSQLRG